MTTPFRPFTWFKSKRLSPTLGNDPSTHFHQTPTCGTWKGEDSKGRCGPGPQPVCKDHHTVEPIGVGVWGEEKQHDLVEQRKNSAVHTRAEGAEWYKNPARLLGAEGKPSTTGFL